MNCLKGLLSLSPYCGLVAPVIADGYLSSLPGISTEMAQKVASGDQITFKDVWDKVETEGALDLKEDVLLILSEKVRFNESQYATREPVLDMATAIAPIAEEKRGVKIELPEGKHVRLALNGVWIHSASEGETIVYVSDAHTGEGLQSLEIELEAGLHYYELSGEYKAKSIYIQMDATVESRYFRNNNAYEQNFYPCQQTCCYDYSELYVMPSINVDITAYGLALWPDVEIICSIESFICTHRKKFAQALKHKFAEKLTQERRASTKLNIFTSTNLEFIADLEKGYREKYDRLLRSALDRINLTQEGSCFDCSDSMEISQGYMRV